MEIDKSVIYAEAPKTSARFITHNGIFHPDELLGLALLRFLFGTEHQVIRTRDPALVNKEDVVFDVFGGELDHHGNGAKHCSAVLIAQRYAQARFIDMYGDECGRYIYDELLKWLDPIEQVDLHGPANGDNQFSSFVRICNQAIGDENEMFTKLLDVCDMFIAGFVKKCINDYTYRLKARALPVGMCVLGDEYIPLEFLDSKIEVYAHPDRKSGYRVVFRYPEKSPVPLKMTFFTIVNNLNDVDEIMKAYYNANK